MAEIDWKEARRYLGLHRGGGTVDEVLEGRPAGLRTGAHGLCPSQERLAALSLALGEGRVETAGLQVETLHPPAGI